MKQILKLVTQLKLARVIDSEHKETEIRDGIFPHRFRGRGGSMPHG